MSRGSQRELFCAAAHCDGLKVSSKYERARLHIRILNMRYACRMKVETHACAMACVNLVK